MTNANHPTVLITGFEPFGGEKVNPSWQAVQQLEGLIIEGHVVVTRELPCEFDTSLESLYNNIALHEPDLVLCIGQAGGRSDISIERIAININDARIQDNAGHQPIDTPVVKGGPAAIFAKLPIKHMLWDLHEAHIPASISNTAGTYVCNHVMYGLCHYIESHKPNLKGGFVHIPYLPSQAVHHNGAPSMAQSTVISALKAMISSALRHDQDLEIAAGTTH
ncbi:pyroglutamyl-peptidase I [Pseudoalteromonas sp. SMS1]|uniref:pyroglutamyl-peptidase I n=1 Tax=Pseudoalteromonas sp. SMS1 TaxID=2908894 RepID=UPI001F40F0B7|nr:pyroglutamyl-peptidase I [Pseudoalteromonas sp. SMS1]MCF2859475.1 pyroglutamyl-peptidase I [Pseudoalteromonas sp. SMS1]